MNFLAFLFVTSLASAEVVILQEKKVDLNKDGKKDSIAWVASSKDAKRPSRLVIRMPGKLLLDLSGNFCSPGEKAPDCKDLLVEKRLSPKKEPLLLLKSGDSTWIYRWHKRAYQPYRASWITKNERHEINYTTGRVLVTSAKRTQTCPLKNSRAGEELSAFNFHDVSEEAECPKAK